MSRIELTEEQRRLLDAEPGRPVDVVDPATKREYVLVARDQFEQVRPYLAMPPVPAQPAAQADPGIPPGILRSQQAFWRDLPELFRSRRNRGKWVCYHGDERIGIARTDVELIQECLRRGLPRDEYHLDVIEPREQAPWEEEEVEPLGPWHLSDDWDEA